MSEPVDIVYEMRHYANNKTPWDDNEYSANVGYKTPEEWADHMEWQEGRYESLVGSFHDKQEEVERLQAALTKQETYCNTYHIYNGRELGDSNE